MAPPPLGVEDNERRKKGRCQPCYPATRSVDIALPDLYYTPRVHRRSVVAYLFDRVLAGSLVPMLDRLMESRRLGAVEIDELREMLDHASR